MRDKDALIRAFRARLDDRIAALEAERAAATAGTRVDGDHRPANRGERAAVTGQGYLAHGIAQRLDDLRRDLRLLDAVAPGPRDRVANGALVRVRDDDGAIRDLLILPGGQGDDVDGVRVVSPDAPIARALHGLTAGDEATTFLGGRETTLEIEAVT